MDDEITGQFVKNFLENLDITKYIWIGATDRDEEGTWRWVDGKEMKYTDWKKGEPNPKKMHDQDCLRIATSKHEKYPEGWTDGECSKLHTFLCEYPEAVIHSHHEL